MCVKKAISPEKGACMHACACNYNDQFSINVCVYWPRREGVYICVWGGDKIKKNKIGNGLVHCCVDYSYTG